MVPNQFPQPVDSKTRAKEFYQQALKVEAEAVVGHVHTILSQAESYVADFKKGPGYSPHPSQDDRQWAGHLRSAYWPDVHNRAMAVRELMSDELNLHGAEYDPTSIHTIDSNESYGSVQSILRTLTGTLSKMTALL